MRILSQDNGKYDLPYENIILEKMMDCNTIYAYTGTGQPFKMAVYSSAEKMNKAMEMLQKAYSPILVMKEQENGIEPNIKPNDFVFGSISPIPKVEVLDNFYFQFPSDDEVEA